MNWFKQQLANVVGTEEPEYGPTAIRSLNTQIEKTPYTILTRDDLKWKALGTTNVETETFYFLCDDGTTAMAQVIYSNVGGLHTTAQFNSKIFNHDGPGKHLWTSDPLSDYGFDETQTNFYAENVAIELNEAGDTYTIKSAVNEENIVNLTLKRTAPGFQVGVDGTSYYGTDLENPWAHMRHAFWPRGTVSGTMQTRTKTYQIVGSGFLSYAIQGGKPHHLAARWNFVNFQGPSYSAVLMQYTTPQSYGKTSVSFGGIAKDGEIVVAGNTEVKHVESKQESEYDWPEPTVISWQWIGEKDGKEVVGSIDGELPQRTDRVDVLAHLPGFVKSFISGATGLKPHIFQYSSKDTLTLKLKIGDEEVSETGRLFSEATFIS
ncbi:hypothetical protein B0A52_05333 [Exophiala mesophila]|uniref:Survival factor 1 n=1 Tax=Exophiala mesophila TaxID=212818 RepID=A0A438N4S9_EXOME|nr:hypothetical protein B0A52_05333 [Exophiala mesophila]